MDSEGSGLDLKDDVAAILNLAIRINEPHDLQDLYQIACESAFNLLPHPADEVSGRDAPGKGSGTRSQHAVDHTAFVRFDEDLRWGTVVAEYPAIGTKGLKVDLSLPDEQRLLGSADPYEIRDVAHQEQLGTVRETLVRLGTGIDSMLWVRVKGKKKTYGSFSLDYIEESPPQGFPDTLKRHCKVLAELLGSAIENGEYYSEIKHLADVSNVAANPPGEALEKLSQMLRNQFQSDFCRIWLVDESNRFLVVRGAAVPTPDTDVMASHAVAVMLDDISVIATVDSPVDFRSSDPNSSDFFQLWPLPSPTIDLIHGVPIRAGEELIGLLEFGFHRSPDAGALAKEYSALFGQIGVIVDSLRTRLLNEGRSALREALEDKTNRLKDQTEYEKLYIETLRFGTELAKWKRGFIYRVAESGEELTLLQKYNQDDEDPLTLHIELATLVRLAAKLGKPLNRWSVDLTKQQNAVALPLSLHGNVLAVMLLLDDNPDRLLLSSEFEVLSRFAGRASSVLQNLPLRESSRVMICQRALSSSFRDLNRLDDRRIACILLTAMTSNAGLRLNRATCFLIDHKNKRLKGLFGVGHFDGVRQAEEWNQMRQTEDYPDIESQLARLLSDSPLPGTPIDEWVRDRGFEIPEIGPIAAALKDLEPCVVSEPVHLPREFQEAMELKGGVGVVPLTVGTEVIGLVAVDNKWTGQQISVADLRALKMLADFAAVAIQQRAMKRRLEVISSLSLSSENPQDPRETLRLIAAATLEATSADAVALMLINEQGQAEDPILSGTITDLEPALKTLLLPSSTEVRQRGVTQAFKASEKVSADVDRCFRLSDIKSALCLPFLHPNPAGVMWIFSLEKRKFDPALRKILELYANHAWAVFDKARRVAHLNQLNKAVSEMSSAPDVQNVTTAIVRKARQLFGAQSSTFWPFEDQEFLYHARVSDGVNLNDLDPPSEGGASWQILKRGYLCRDDIAKPDDEGYRASYDFLARQGLRSFQGVALKVADTPLGVLFVSYNSPRRFRVRDKDELKEFATCAALALQNAKFFELKQAGRRAAEKIVQCNVLKAPEESFKLIAEAIKAALHAEVVLLYTYDQERDCVSFPPVWAGELINEGRMLEKDEQIARKLVLEVLRNEGPVVIRSARESILLEHLKDNQFAECERIEARIIQPLTALGKSVGVAFINYRKPKDFTRDDLENLSLLSAQAATAIANKQLYDGAEAQRHLRGILLRLLQVGNVNREEFARGLQIDILPKVSSALNSVACGINLSAQRGHPELISRYTRAGVEDRQFRRLQIPIHNQGAPVGEIWAVPRREQEFAPYESEFLRTLGNLTVMAWGSVSRAA